MRYLIIVLTLFYIISVPAAASNEELFSRLNIDDWQDAGYTGDGVYILVNDRGSLYDRQRLTVDVYRAPYEINKTHAGSVVDIIQQIAPDAHIIYVPAHYKSHESMFHLAANYGVQLVNHSMSPHDPDTEIAEAHNILLIGAAGNTTGQVNYLNSDSWVSVGAALDDDTRAGYSSYGQGLDVMSYTGINVCKYNFCARGAETYFQGTSASTPMVTGMMALYYQQYFEHHNRFPTNDEARAFIYSNTKDLEQQGYDIYTGHGLFILPEIGQNYIYHPTNKLAVLMERPDGQRVWVHKDYVIESINDFGYRAIYKD